MVMNPEMAVDLTRALAEDFHAQRTKLDEIDKFLSSENPVQVVARKAHTNPNSEHNALARLAHTPLLSLVVAETAQQLVLEGVTTDDPESAARLWWPWERNGLVSRQGALWSATIGYGTAHVIALPGETVYRDGRMQNDVWMGGFSPRDLHVEWGDVFQDEHPAFALRVVGQPGNRNNYRLYDEEAVYFLADSDRPGGIDFIDAQIHGMGVCPVVSFHNDLDLEGRSPGEVQKFKTPAMRHDKTVNDRLLAQHFNSWKVRTVSGIEQPETPEEVDELKIKLSNDSILTGEEGVTFGSLPETTLDGFIRAADADRDMLAAVSQTPVWALNGGQLVNLSADALVEARAMQRLKIEQKQRANGVSVARALRLGALAAGRFDDADDFSVKPVWADVESRSLSQVADALGKVVTMLGVPAELVLDMIPGVSPSKAKEWREFMRENPSEREQLAATLNRQLRG